jgi:hypothetical protein
VGRATYTGRAYQGQPYTQLSERCFSHAVRHSGQGRVMLPWKVNVARPGAIRVAGCYSGTKGGRAVAKRATHAGRSRRLETHMTGASRPPPPPPESPHMFLHSGSRLARACCITPKLKSDDWGTTYNLSPGREPGTCCKERLEFLFFILLPTGSRLL